MLCNDKWIETCLSGACWECSRSPLLGSTKVCFAEQAIRRRERLGIKRKKSSWRWARDDYGGRAGWCVNTFDFGESRVEPRLDSLTSSTLRHLNKNKWLMSF